MGRLYFPEALIQTFENLGGEFAKIVGGEVIEYEPILSRKKLKHWNDYRWWNRPSSNV